MWYLHAPDHTVPYDITLKAVNDLYKEGYFKRFGISNYAAYAFTSLFHIEILTYAHQMGGSRNCRNL